MLEDVVAEARLRTQPNHWTREKPIRAKKAIWPYAMPGTKFCVSNGRRPG